MFLKYFPFLLASIVVSQAVVKVTIYYEPLCPDSVQFITEQVYPTWQALGSTYLELDFVPYGKGTHARTTGWYGPSMQFWFQHGSGAYWGNKLQACGIRALQHSPYARAQFVNCVMSDPWPPYAGPLCTQSFDNHIRSNIRNCYEGAEGDQLLSEFGMRTLTAVPYIRLNPNMGVIPQVEFNGVHQPYDQAMAMTSFKWLVCSKLDYYSSINCHNRQIPPRGNYPPLLEPPALLPPVTNGLLGNQGVVPPRTLAQTPRMPPSQANQRVAGQYGQNSGPPSQPAQSSGPYRQPPGLPPPQPAQRVVGSGPYAQAPGQPSSQQTQQLSSSGAPGQGVSSSSKIPSHPTRQKGEW